MCRLVARLLLSAPGLVTSLRTTSCSRCVSEASRICSGLPPPPPLRPAGLPKSLLLGARARAALAPGDFDEQLSGRGSVEPQLAAVHLFDRLDQRLGRFILLHHSRCAAQHEALAHARIALPDQHQDARAVLSHESRNDFVDVLATVLGIDQHDVGRDSRRERAGKSARGRRRDDFHRRAPFVDNPVQTQQSNAILANEHHAYWRSHPPPPSPLRSNSPGVKISDSWPAGYACP